MKINLALMAIIGLCSVSGEAYAQSALDKYLKKNTEAASGTGNADEAGINKVFKSPEGYWRLDDSRSTGGMCAITYVASAYIAGYLGPIGNTTDAFMVFSGPTIPAIKKEKRKQMTITGADGLSQTTQAVHAPNSKDAGSIYFRLTGIQAAMDEMSDVETVTIGMDKKQVFSLKWKGGHTARAALQKCLTSAVTAGAK